MTENEKVLAVNKDNITENIFNTNIIAHNDPLSFPIADFRRSGISDDVIQEYIEKGFLTADENAWQLNYPELYNNCKTDYYNKRIKNPKSCKYIKPKDLMQGVYRPLHLSPKCFSNPQEYIIITEGEKKAIKAVQEGFNCVAISGVWAWKKKPKIDENNDGIIVETSDIIPDILNIEWNNKTVILCYDADLWKNPQVKNALYSFASYLIGEKKAIVKILILPDGEEKGIDDFLIAKGKQAFKELLDNANMVTLKDIQNILSGASEKKLKFPIEIFEPNLSTLLSDLAKRMDAPNEYAASAFLIGASALMDGRYSLIVKPSTNWVEYPIMWGAIVGTASQKKTPCINNIKNVITKIEKDLYKDSESKESDYNRAMIDYKIELDNYKNKKKNNPNVVQPQEPKKPNKQMITVQNTTVEALATLISQNNDRGISIFVDELASFIKSLGQYKNGSGADEEYFLQAWKKQEYILVRKTANENILTTPSHNILGTIQPKILEKTLFKDGFDTTNGMLERWLYICTDYEETGEDYQEDAIYDVGLIESIYNSLYANNVNKEYKFSVEAQKVFDSFRKQIISAKKSPAMTELMKSYIQKQTDYVARFSLVLNCIEDMNRVEVNATTVKNAIKLSTYFIECFKKIAVVSTDNQSNSLALSTLNYLKIKNIKQISPSKLKKSNHSKYKTYEHALYSLETLANCGHGRLEKTPNNKYRFNLYT